MVERRSHEDQNNGHPDRRVGTVLDVPALCVSPCAKQKNPHLASAGAEGAFHLQSVS